MKLNINDEQGIEILYWILDRELMPPFVKGETPDHHGDYAYYNQNGNQIGWLRHDKTFGIFRTYLDNIGIKICAAFEFSLDSWVWWDLSYSHIKFWIENQINTEIELFTRI